MKQYGVLDHEYRPKGGCRLRDDCPAKGEKLLKVMKLDLNSSGDCEGEEIDLKGDWCDLCLKMVPISAIRFTCLNEKCYLHGKGLPVNLCSNCDKHGSVKCPFSAPYWQYKYPGDHEFVKMKMLQEFSQTLSLVLPQKDSPLSTSSHLELFIMQAHAQLKLIEMIMNEYDNSDNSDDIASGSADKLASNSNALETGNSDRLNFLTEVEQVRMVIEQSLEDENVSREARTMNYEVC